MDNKIKVIVADDEKKIAEINSNIAKSNENVEVVGIAYNGKEELDMILELEPDLVITDNKMPEMNGIEVIEKINTLAIENKPDFILVTGEYNMELNRKCNELQVFRVLDKLSAGNGLLYTIEEYVESQDNSNKELVNNIRTENKKTKGFFSKLFKNRK